MSRCGILKSSASRTWGLYECRLCIDLPEANSISCNSATCNSDKNKITFSSQLFWRWEQGAASILDYRLIHHHSFSLVLTVHSLTAQVLMKMLHGTDSTLCGDSDANNTGNCNFKLYSSKASSALPSLTAVRHIANS